MLSVFYFSTFFYDFAPVCAFGQRFDAADAAADMHKVMLFRSSPSQDDDGTNFYDFHVCAGCIHTCGMRAEQHVLRAGVSVVELCKYKTPPAVKNTF